MRGGFRFRSPLGIVCLTLLALMVLSAVGATVSVVSSLARPAGPDNIKHIGDMDRATTVYDRHDRFAFSIARERRLEVHSTAISPAMIQAILAIEDRRFYSHPGFDLSRILSSAVANVRRRHVVQGAQHHYATAGAPELSHL